jgi:branched-chain amino acid transport system permease protein
VIAAESDVEHSKAPESPGEAASSRTGLSLHFGRSLARGPLAIAAILVLVDVGVTGESDLSQLAVALTYAVAASGLGFALGLGGEYVLAQGSIFACSAYATAIMVVNHGWSFWLAALVGVAAAIVLGLILSVPGLRVSRFYLAMVGFFLVALTPDIVQVFSGQTGGSAGLSLPSSPTFFGRSLGAHGMFVLGAVALVLSLWLLQNVRDSPFGVHVRRMRDDPFVVAGAGVSTWKVRILIYLVASTLAGISGAIYSEINGYLAPYYFDITFTILLFASVVVGGQTGLMGPVLGIFLLYVIPRMIVNVPGYSDLIYGATVLIGVVILRDGVEDAINETWRVIRRRAPTRRASRERIPAAQAVASSDLSTLLWALRPQPFERATLTVHDAQKAYGGNAALEMDDGSVVAVAPGKVHLLLGPNGSGKTTLVNAMCGLARLDRGHIAISGSDVTHSAPVRIARSGVSRSYQAPRLPNELTPLDLIAGALAHMENVGAPHWLLNDLKARRARAKARRFAGQILTAAGLEAAKTVPNRSLSSGQRRILDVMMALASRSSIILLDEPAAGLSAEERQALARTVRNLAEHGIAFLVVEHDLELGFSLADEVTVLANGRIVAQGEPRAVRENAVAREVLMGAVA